MKRYLHRLLRYLAEFFLEGEMLQSEVEEEIKKPIFLSEVPFSENHAIYGIMWDIQGVTGGTDQTSGECSFC